MTDHPPQATIVQLAESREMWMEEAERWKKLVDEYHTQQEALLLEVMEERDKNRAAYEAALLTLQEALIDASEMAVIRDRYRAALEKIANLPPPQDLVVSLEAVIAREAL